MLNDVMPRRQYIKVLTSNAATEMLSIYLNIMRRHKIPFVFVWCLAFGLGTVAGRPNDSSHSYKDVDANKNTTLECPALSKVRELNETYAFVKWYIWTDDGINNAFWEWFAGMTQSGEIKAPKGFNISKVDGSLYIDKARPCDARDFMCKVERKNGLSPKDHRVTLRLREENGNQTKTSAQKKNNKPRDCECKKEPRQNEPTLLVIIYVLSALLALALIVILIQNRSFLRKVFRRCTHPTATQAPEGGGALESLGR